MGAGVVRESNRWLDMIPDEGPFAGQALRGVFRVDDSGRIVSLELAYPGHERAALYVADPHQVYETWQRVETASGSLVM